MYAVFRTGGKQYRASEGDRLKVEKLDGEEGADVTFGEVLLVGAGSDVEVGSPTLSGMTVVAKVLRQGKSRKVPVVKFRRRQNYLKQGSHRQAFTEIEITSIGKKSGKKKAAAADAKTEKGEQAAAKEGGAAKKARKKKKAAGSDKEEKSTKKAASKDAGSAKSKAKQSESKKSDDKGQKKSADETSADDSD